MLTFMLPSNPGKRGFGFCHVENKLEEIQNLVGGYIEVLPLKDNLVMIIDEEGKLKNRQKNELATAILQYYVNTSDYIVGHALLVCTNEEDFEDFNLKEYYNEVMQVLKSRLRI